MKTKFVGLLVVAIMMATSLFAEAKIIRVPADYPTIQEGIDAALTGDIVLVADGTYTGDGNKNLDFNGKAITVRSENGPESTIIDCEVSGRGFYFHSGEGIGSQVKGFTVKYADSSGIYCAESSPLIENNIVTNNSSSSDGGGIYCYHSSPAIQNNEITNNLANNKGGGIACEHYSSPLIENNNIMWNSALNNGGGISSDGYSDPIIRNNQIKKNSANDEGGGIFCSNPSDPNPPEIKNNKIIQNAAFYGGGIACHLYSSPKIINNLIIRNTSNYGGGISVVYSSTPFIENSTIAQNSAQ
ncbi:right-handed parallel beta-helix repeat-containing protein [bacterium]|nr:right-handed parallel beta-helix repeat-containing protein [bacterium]